jgi:transcriptional regulator with PAS, ATPase and Fis domain
MNGHEFDQQTVSVVRLSTLLDSLRAMYAACPQSEPREVLGQHIVTLVREFVPADEGTIELGHDCPESDLSEKHPEEHRPAAKASPSRRAGTPYRISAPLSAQGQTAGTLSLERRRSKFTDTERLTLSAIARMASAALERKSAIHSPQGEVQQPREESDSTDDMAGDSEALRKLRHTISRVAVTDTTVLILGESGTGKELVAGSLHRQSRRSKERLLAINCAALNDTLLESELFGHEKGAFTGATELKRGLLEAAQGGTVFLDEIGEMQPSLQAKLLRVLQTREFQRVGGTQTILLDVRIVAATNRDLGAAIRKGTFREDLFYRLNVVTLRTPPLRERPEDILPLARLFASRLAAKWGGKLAGIAPSACRMLQSYDWPGNVRELQNTIEYAVVLGTQDTILPENLPEFFVQRWAETSSRESGTLQDAVVRAKSTAVKHAFELAGQDHQEAARFLGVHPNYLYKLMKNLDLELP